jgi:hypothetical protein
MCFNENKSKHHQHFFFEKYGEFVKEDQENNCEDSMLYAIEQENIIANFYV